MNLTTKTNKTGTITVSGTVKGKRRQLTVPYDENISRVRNHGRAGGAFANKFLSHEEARALGTAITTVQASWKENENQGFTFTFHN